MPAPICLAFFRLRAALLEQREAMDDYCWRCTSWGFPSLEAKNAADEQLVRIRDKVETARALAWCGPADPSAIAEQPSGPAGLSVIPGGQARAFSLPDRTGRAALSSRPGRLSGGDAA